jgi:hypothetical protein
MSLQVDRSFPLGGDASISAFVWIQNLLNQRNTLGVWRASGQPDSDGFLDTNLGADEVRARASAVGAAIGGDAFAAHYSRYVDAPIGVGGNHYSGGEGGFQANARYSLPRQIRLGLRLNF